MRSIGIIIGIGVLSICGCVREQDTLFTALLPEESGVDFENRITETEEINYFTHRYIMYNGAGVGIGDINNDGLADLFFGGNMVDSRLYLNKGNMKFEDISQQAGVLLPGVWVTGVTMHDINNDGLLDIYLSVSGTTMDRRNKCLINNGDLTFSEQAEEYGIDINGKSIQSVFFDYDHDGLNDLLVINYPEISFSSSDAQIKAKTEAFDYIDSDKLYRQTADGFVDVTEQAGIKNFGMSLSVSVADYNGDQWPDIYISNDFATPDHFFVNQGDGTFKDELQAAFKHTAYFGMGSDMADVNNDGWIDLIQLDMTPEDNFRAKANMANMSEEGFYRRVDFGFHYQYKQNNLQLNRGLQPGTQLPIFSDVARIAGVATTDWSWSVLAADFDNDGWKDLFITNGIRREVNNMDYFIGLSKKSMFKKGELSGKEVLEQVKGIPSFKTPNYAFKNNGDLTYNDVSEQWGLDLTGFSNGTAYGDLDNDGDLDLVVCSLDSPAIVYRNNAPLQNYLKIKLNGPAKNTLGIGTKVKATMEDGSVKLLTQQPVRGYMSSVDPVLHFGLGKSDSITGLTVTWPDGKRQILQSVKTNQLLELNYEDAHSDQLEPPEQLQKVLEKVPFDGRHVENEFNDYYYQVLLPHKLSQFGPALAVADVDGDGNDDFFAGGASGQPSMLFTYRNGTFIKKEINAFADHKMHEDVGAAFLDVDNDQDQDLYVVSGGNEFEEGSSWYQDRLYLNDGEGNFEYAEGALPEMYISGQAISVADFDEDGDQDIFLGGRLVPRKWPKPASSVLLRNDTRNGQLKFTDVTKNIAPELNHLGCVTASVWMDVEQDGDEDLVVAGEWMPVMVFEKSDSGFKKRTDMFSGLSGWWYSLDIADLDDDGDQDLIAGNLGLNYKYEASKDSPLEVFAGDLDNNRVFDVILGYHQHGKLYPVRGRTSSAKQMPGINFKIPTYNQFASMEVEEIYDKALLDKSINLTAEQFASGFFVHEAHGNYTFREFNNYGQLSAVNAVLFDDFDQDGINDLLIAGNLFTAEVETPRNDASIGLFMKGTGNGEYEPMPLSQSGFYAPGDVKHMHIARTKHDGSFVIVANNDDKIQVFRYVPKGGDPSL